MCACAGGGPHLGGEQRELLGEVEAHLHAELGEGARAGAVAAAHPRRDHVAHEVEVLVLLVRGARRAQRARHRGARGEGGDRVGGGELGELVREGALDLGRRTLGLEVVAVGGGWEEGVAPKGASGAAALGGGRGGGGPVLRLVLGGHLGLGRRGELGDLGQVDLGAGLAELHRLGVHRAAADHEHRLDARAQLGASSEQRQSALERLGEHDAVGERQLLLRGGVAREHDVDPVVQRPELRRDRLPRLAAHDHRVPLARVRRRPRELLEVGHVAAEPPRQPTLDPDPARRLARRDDHREGALHRRAMDLHLAGSAEHRRKLWRARKRRRRNAREILHADAE